MKNKRTIKVAENLEVSVMPSVEHEFVMTTAEVAKGYGVSGEAIRHQMERNPLEFIEGKHCTKGVTNCHTLGANIQPHQTFWTKREIVRLGFIVRSERARMFRDCAEDFIANTMEQAEKAQQLNLFPEPAKRQHNRLTQSRLVEVLSIIARIENSSIRNELADKLTSY